jgi:hypothetical protein
MDKPVYSDSSTITVTLSDIDLSSNPYQDVLIAYGSNTDTEQVRLYPVSGTTGIFSGSIQTDTGPPYVLWDGYLQVADGSTITATYYDLDDGSGNYNIVETTAQTRLR